MGAAGVGSAAGRQSEQSVLCVGTWSGPPSSGTHCVPMLVQTSVMPVWGGIGEAKTMLQLSSRQSTTHCCKARLGFVKWTMHGL